jgi:hypothetical protein
MYRVAPKIAKKIGVLFKNNHADARPRQQVPQHHSRRAATRNATPCLDSYLWIRQQAQPLRAILVPTTYHLVSMRESDAAVRRRFEEAFKMILGRLLCKTWVFTLAGARLNRMAQRLPSSLFG